MPDKSPADELLEVLQKHREKALQPPAEPQWEGDQGSVPPEPQEEPPEAPTWT